MNQKFHQFRDGVMERIMDDTIAWKIMEELGLIHAFTDQAASATNISAVISEGHPTHWCTCLRFNGFADPAENGLMVIAYRKSMVSIETVRTDLANLVSDCKTIEFRSAKLETD